MAELGILTSEYPRPTLGATLDAVAGLGLRSVQLQLGSAVPDVALSLALQTGLDAVGDRIDAERCDAIRAEIDARHLAVAAVDGTYNMIHPDTGRRAANLERLKSLIGRCGRLGTSVVTLCTGSREDIMWRRHSDNDSPAAWADLVAAVGEAAATAEQHGVTLAFEPEVSNVVDSADKARRLIDEIGSPTLKVVMDPANIFHAGELPRMPDMLRHAFGLLGPEIALAHAKDVDRDGQAGHLGAGRGRLDYRLYLSLLAASGFDGTVVLHQLRGLTDEEIGDCVEFVRRQAPEGFFA